MGIRTYTWKQQGNGGWAKALNMWAYPLPVGENTAFAAQVDPIKAAAHPGLRFIMVTATLPQHSALQLKESFRDMALVSGPGLHRTAAGRFSQ
jgi:ATP-dependent RNA helicase DDX18/HAS1